MGHDVAHRCFDVVLVMDAASDQGRVDVLAEVSASAAAVGDWTIQHFNELGLQSWIFSAVNQPLKLSPEFLIVVLEHRGIKKLRCGFD